MYSFEGEYRRRPEQNLGGSTCSENRDQCLQKAHLERQKREETRKRYLCSIKIQSYVRSYLIRSKNKNKHRNEFIDIISNQKFKTTLNMDLLNTLVKKLLFFYDTENDGNHLIFISRLILDKQFKSEVLGLSFNSSTSWYWQLRKILLLNLRLLCDKCQDKDFNNATSLRILEVFTKYSDVSAILNNKLNVVEFIKFFKFLIKNKYFEYLRILIDAKVPPLIEATSSAPTPLSRCLFDLLITPINLINLCKSLDMEFNSYVMEELIKHIVLMEMTEPIKLYILPALSVLKSFPIEQFIHTIYSNIKNNSLYYSSASLKNQQSLKKQLTSDWTNFHILYSLLYIDKSHSFLTNKIEELQLISEYLYVIGYCSKQLVLMAQTTEDDEDEVDSDVEMRDSNSTEEVQMSKYEQAILTECWHLIDESSLTQGILGVVERYCSEENIIHPLCQLCHNLLMSHKLACHKFRLLHMLALNHKFIRNLYELTVHIEQKSLFGNSTTLLQVISRGSHTTLSETQQIVPLLATFCSLFSLQVTTLHDVEFYSSIEDNATTEQVEQGINKSVTSNKMPFSLSELVRMSYIFKDVVLGLIELAFPNSRPSDKEQYKFNLTSSGSNKNMVAIWSHLFKVLVHLLRQIHSRDSRKQFCPNDHWTCTQLSGMLIHFENPASLNIRRSTLQSSVTRNNIRRSNLRNLYRPFHGLPAFTREELEEGPPLTTKEVRTLTVLHEVPFLLSFQERVLVFQNLVVREKMTHQEQSQFLQGPQIHVSVRRNYIYEDAFDKLSLENEPELRQVMRVQLINAIGLDEAGIDGGGLFREFLSELLKTAVDPKLGFFKLTEDNLLYPNPSVELIHSNHLKHYFFIGRMLGKALYENLLVEIPLADLFLSKLVSRHSDVDIHHLATLDGLLYKNLLYLKHYEDVSTLGLDFTVLCDELGERKIIELKPNGADIPVTNSNRIEYIHLVADYYLNRRIRSQCNAFKQGLANVISLDWIQMFNSKELQVLISGAEIPVNIDDLKQHTAYAGGYTEDHETIKLFWKVVAEFNDKQKRQLLKFVTSCSRPPLLGFRELDPPFGIQLTNAEDRLPSASTCMNLLKLPKFQDLDKLRDRLIYAISSGAGFELS